MKSPFDAINHWNNHSGRIEPKWAMMIVETERPTEARGSLLARTS
jgi:hypothetical protein